MTEVVQISPIQDEIPVIQAKINPRPPAEDLFNTEPDSEKANRRLYTIGICLFVVVVCLSLVVGFYGFTR